MTDEAINLKMINQDLRESLKKHTEYLVTKSRVVFSTISNFVLSSTLRNCDFDNLIVDEASMLAYPSLIAVASKIKRRIILVGDFLQLPPIALVPDPLLNENVFQICGINSDNTNHPALYPLLNQRRSYFKIVELFNETFYDNKLVPVIEEEHPFLELEPYAKRPIGLKDVKDGVIRYTNGGTRQNKPFAEAVVSILDKLSKSKNKKFSVGVITPYTGQVSLIRALISERKFKDTFTDRLKVGTIHTFQGSECDVVIFDTVDCGISDRGRKVGLGKIYCGQEGEQLLNVAISRARYKLIVVCSVAYISNPPGNTITTRSRNIFKKLYNFRFVKE